ncbi:unnamed protein product [Hydatigera taeniaeformis]|uniref:HIG1 domain-containing protein n=1 Tax=Hydatigena taeniaeformis TaxID=6205 RepID=A0A0R3X5K0_HYDTA|nr:unnamed protein product [Hydatigera taeniaeformis]
MHAKDRQEVEKKQTSNYAEGGRAKCVLLRLPIAVTVAFAWSRRLPEVGRTMDHTVTSTFFLTAQSACILSSLVYKSGRVNFFCVTNK